MRCKLYAALVAAVLMVGCAGKAPASLSPAGAKIYAANQAVTVVNLVQSTAINLNAATPQLLSDANTRIVGNAMQSARRAIEQTPDGWRAVTVASLTQVRSQLDAVGKQQMAAWLDVAATMIKEIK